MLSKAISCCFVGIVMVAILNIHTISDSTNCSTFQLAENGQARMHRRATERKEEGPTNNTTHIAAIISVQYRAMCRRPSKANR